MKLSEFEARYFAAESGLKTKADNLHSNIKEALKTLTKERLKKGMPIHNAHIRLHEVRYKDCMSLFRKIIGDSALDPEKVFTMDGHVRDLIGARIVCHTLSDLNYLFDSLEADTFQGLHYMRPPKGEKNKSKVPDPNTGYMGLHLDIKWARGENEFNYAELQLRTMLQDAWASLFHDLYKEPEGLLPKELHLKVRALSGRLHELDVEAQGLIEEIAAQRLYGEGHINRLDAINNDMYAMAAVGASVMAVSPYSRVRRHDRYVIGVEDLFDFTIEAECKKPTPFSMVIAGDTPNTQMSVDLIEHIDQNGQHEVLSTNEYRVNRSTQPNRMATLTRPKWKAKRHHYRIVCTWRGVFDLPLESIWCPWGTTYPGALVEYQLTLEFRKKPFLDPKILRPAKYDSLVSAIKAYTDGVGEVGKYYYDDNVSRHIYQFEPKDVGDMLCFFKP